MVPAQGPGVSDMRVLDAALPKQEVPDVTMVAPPAKPDAMDQSFWESLSSHFPTDLIAYMASENIHSLEDLACYCSTQEELTEALLDVRECTRGQRKYKVPMTKL